jgi:hypothetical protein
MLRRRRQRRAQRAALVGQGAYYVLTGPLPFMSRSLFEAITGPKREWWLVQTVAALVTVVGAGLISAGRSRRDTPEVVAIAAGCAASMAAIDVVYVARGRIAPTYLGDAAAQVAALAALAGARARRHDDRRRPRVPSR